MTKTLLDTIKEIEELQQYLRLTQARTHSMYDTITSYLTFFVQENYPH